jgi:hypothetical protein
MVPKQWLERAEDKPVDLGSRKPLAKGVEKRQTVNHVSQGTGLDDQDLPWTD